MKVAKFGLSLFGINTYVVVDPETRDCAIIDPGMINEEERNAVVRFVEKNNLKVTHLINTHLHIDHAIGNAFVKKQFGVETEAHPDDAFLGNRIAEQAREFGLPEAVEPVSIDKPLKDGEIIHIGDGELEVIHVPGHSPGGIALYDRKDGFLIAGDILFQGSVGRADLPGGDMNALVFGIKSKLLTLPENTTVFPGHGPATTIGDEKAYNPYLR